MTIKFAISANKVIFKMLETPLPSVMSPQGSQWGWRLVGGGSGLGDMKEEGQIEGWALVPIKKGRQTREKGGLSHFLLCNAPCFGEGGPKATDCDRHWAMNQVVIT